MSRAKALIRSALALLVGGALWLSEGILFSNFLMFSRWQTVLMLIMYVSLYCAALWILRAQLRFFATTNSAETGRFSALSAPMVVVVVGSFFSLPVVVFIAALGKVFG